MTDRVSWKVHRETALLLGWGRAILLQLAHPLVARGVRDHSSFRGGVLAPWRRLHSTLGAMLALTFGGDAAARQALDGINRIHDRVHGRLPGAEGPFAAGHPYSAHDPELLRWVHVTCVDSFLLAYERFVAPLTAGERDRYCEEAAAIETGLGMPPGWLPRSMGGVERCIAGTIASGVIAVGDTARELVRDLLAPPGLGWIPPLRWLAALPVVGLLPSDIRRAYGFAWSRGQERALGIGAALVRRALPWTPPALRYWPAAREAAGGGCIIPARSRQ